MAEPKGSSTRSGLASLLAGASAGQLILALATPLLSRTFSPAEFGQFSVILAASAVFVALATGRYDLAVPLPESPHDGAAAVGVAMVISSTTATAATAALWLLQTWLDLGPLDSALLLLAPLMCALQAAVQTLNAWAIRRGDYRRLAVRTLAAAGGTVSCQLVLGIAGLGEAGLLLGWLAGQAGGLGLLLINADLKKIAFHPRAMQRLAVRYYRFPLQLAPAGLMNALSVHLPTLAIGWLFGPTAAGIFAMAQRILAVPVAVLGQSVAQVYLSELSRARRHRESDMRAGFRLATARLTMVALLMTAVCVATAPWVFQFVLGARWQESGVLAQALVISVGAQLVAGPLSQTLIVLERTKTQLAWDALRLISLTAAYIAAEFDGWTLTPTVWLASAVSLALYALCWWLSRRALSQAALGKLSAEPA